MSDDTISRNAAIEAMEDVDWYHVNSDGQLVHGANSKEDEPLYKASDVYAVLNQMPSAQPDLDEVYAHAETEAEARFHAERKKGKWIYGEDYIGRDGWICDKCGHFIAWDYSVDLKSAEKDLPNFCPNCGAEMKDPEDIPMEYFESGGR